jgi:hypothetical protein
MKKLYGFILAVPIVVAPLASATSCSLFKYSALGDDISEWDLIDVTERNSDLPQAVTTGKSGIYLNPAPNATPFIDTSDGSFSSIDDVWNANWGQNQAKETTIGSKLGAYQLDYIIDSYIVYYQNNAKNSGDAKLKTLEDFQANFEIAYFLGADNTGKASVYEYPGQDGTYKSEQFKGADSRLQSQTTDNYWSKNEATINGGYAAIMSYDGAGQTGTSNEMAHVSFNYDIFIKKDHTKTIQDSDGNTVEIPVSKDGFYSTDASTHYQYVTGLTVILFTLPIF